MAYLFYTVLISLLLFSYNSHSSEVQDSALFYKDVRIVIAPLASVYCQPNENSLCETQKLHGHNVQVIKEIDPSWAQVQIDDKTTGYMKTIELIQKNICTEIGKVFSDDLGWRADKNLMRIKDKAVLIYPTPSVKNKPLTILFCNSYVKKCSSLDDKIKEFTQIELADGLQGWICSGSLEPIEPLDREEIINRITEFIGIPYIWGGASTNGYDCSGLTQFIAQLAGYYIYHSAKLQAQDDKCTIAIPYEQLTKGDFLYFGRNGQITHTGLYIGNDTILHAATLPESSGEDKGVYKHCIMTTQLNNGALPPFISARRLLPLTYYGTIEKINQNIFAYINGVSWKDNNPIPLDDLRLLTITYWDFDKCIHYDGKIIVHEQVAQEAQDIFKELFLEKYLIEKVKLIEEYNGVDGYSCADNNSSAFCSRQFTNGTLWSLHSFGLAIDINTRLNPYVYFNFDKKGNDYVGPVQGKEFVYNRNSLTYYGLIKKNDPCYNAFIKNGWKWAGEWREELLYPYDDYQHFYKDQGLSPELTALAKANEPKPEYLLEKNDIQ